MCFSFLKLFLDPFATSETCRKPLPKLLFLHGLHKKIFHTQFKGMKGKIQITAPDYFAFGVQGTKMLGSIQPCYPRKRQKHNSWYRLLYLSKKLFLILINLNQGKYLSVGTLIQNIFCIILPLLFFINQYSNAIHESPPFPLDFFLHLLRLII